ncbi:MAG: flavin reductase family protein [Desulfobacterales bacterium]
MKTANQLQASVGRMTYGIYALTAAYEDVINAMIASWVSQVSHDPYLIMVGIHPNRFSHHLIENSGRFALHVMAEHQIDLMRQFKLRDPNAKFSGLDWTPGKTGCPILADCICFMECEVTQRLMPGNHTLFIGNVVNAGVNADKTPLSTLDYSGVYVGDT